MSPRPPLPLRLLARLLLRARHREFVLGDLEEIFRRRAERRGRAAAALTYSLDALGSVFAGLRSGRRGGTGGPRLLPGAGSGAAGPGDAGPGAGGRPPRGGPGLDPLADLRLALRSVRSERSFVALAVATLALGVGTSAAVFGMADQILLRPLPGVGDGAGAAYFQLRSVQEPERTQGHGLATLDFDELRRSATLLEGMASFGYVGLKVAVGDARPVSARGSTVYGDYFETLRAWPAAGRLLSAAETDLDSDPLKVVLSEELAARLFGSVADAPGSSIRMNGRTVTVVGVAGGGFAGAERGVGVDAWLPYGALVPLVGFTRERLVDRESVMHDDIVLRPRPGVGTDAVLSQVSEILQRLIEAGNESGPYLADLRPWIFEGLHVPPLVRAATYSSLRMLAIVVGLVLILACANVANLLLFRNVKRRGAVATLRALGASTGRIARQQLALSLVIGLLGTLAGIGVGWLVALPFKGASLMRMPAFDGLALDGRVALFGAAAGVVTAALFGTVPALLAGRVDLAASLRSSSPRETGRLARVRSALSVLQLSLGLALVVGALLLLRTMRNLHAVDLGLDTEGIVALTVDIPRGLEPAELDVLHRDLLAAAGTQPEVRGAAADPYGPFGPGMMGRVRLPTAPDDERIRAYIVPVTPGWLELLRARMVGGRSFRDEDWSVGGPASLILTESLARRLFGRTDVVGQTVEAGFGPPEPMEVIGVVADIRSPYAPDRPQDTFFVTPSRTAGILPMLTLVMRVTPFNPEVAGRIRADVERVLPDEPVPDPVPISDRLDRVNSEARIYSSLLALLSTLAMVLSAIGLYGVMAFTVAARGREFGVRLALGAAAGRIARLVVRSASAIVLSGTALGLLGAYALSRLLESRLFGVTPLDPASYAAAALILAAVAAVACWVPARRAIRVDPVSTLREE